MTPQHQLSIVRRARELISEPGTWTQDDFAQDNLGDAVNPTSASACAWSVPGAFTLAALKVVGLPESGEAFIRVVGSMSEWLRDQYIHRGLMAWNYTEGRTHAEVIELLDRYIAHLEWQEEDA